MAKPKAFKFNGYIIILRGDGVAAYFGIFEFDDKNLEKGIGYSRVDGFLENDLIDGILFIQSTSKISSEEEFINFQQAHHKHKNLTRQRLLKEIPITINGNYDDPF